MERQQIADELADMLPGAFRYLRCPWDEQDEATRAVQEIVPDAVVECHGESESEARLMVHRPVVAFPAPPE